MSIGDFFNHIACGTTMGMAYGMMSQMGGGMYLGGGMGLFGGYPSLFGYGLFDCHSYHHQHHHHCPPHHGWWC